MSEIVIRPETPADHHAIRRVVTAAFGSSVEAELVDRIRASPEYVAELALVAVLVGRRADGIVGHVMISGARLVGDDGVERRIAMLSPLAVDPVRHRQGIGGALVRAACTASAHRGDRFVVLEGSPAYYARFGFEPAIRYGVTMPLPDWAPVEAAQILLLGDAVDADVPAGRVVYPPAFDDVG